MRLGNLDQRITILAPSITQNSMNEDVTTWPVFKQRWAQAIEGQGREFVKGGQITAQKAAAFRLRYTGGITTGHRLTWGGVLYEILNVTGTMRSGETWLHCQTLPEGTTA